MIMSLPLLLFVPPETTIENSFDDFDLCMPGSVSAERGPKVNFWDPAGVMPRRSQP